MTVKELIRDYSLITQINIKDLILDMHEEEFLECNVEIVPKLSQHDDEVLLVHAYEKTFIRLC